jgi:hypothetical protein
VTLTRSGDVTVSQNGAVIDALDVTGSISVNADNVTIKRTRVTSGDFWPIRVLGGHRGLLVQDVDIIGQPGCEAGIAFQDFTAQRVDVSGCVDGMKVGSRTTVLASYIHDLQLGGGSHNDGIQGTGGTGTTIRGNSIVGSPNQVSCILLGEEDGPMDNALIENNWLDGGGFMIYIGYGTTVPNATIRFNRFGRNYGWGLLNANPRAGVVWVGNVWDDTGLPVAAF